MNGRGSGALPCPEGTGGSEGELDALLYDWHNAYRLRAQRGDVGYWVELTSGIDRLLVCGAGRAVSQCRLPGTERGPSRRSDVSFARLRRMPAVPGLVPVCSDMRSLPLRSGFGAAIVPYSTLQLLLTVQDRAQALVEAARVLDKGALLHIDVSGNFAARSAADWYIEFSAPCPAVGETVVEWERRSVLPDHVPIEKSFRAEDGAVLLAVKERWVFLRALDLDVALDRAGVDVVGIDRGYGADRSPHRLVYHARRRP